MVSKLLEVASCPVRMESWTSPTPTPPPPSSSAFPLPAFARRLPRDLKPRAAPGTNCDDVVARDFEGAAASPAVQPEIFALSHAAVSLHFSVGSAPARTADAH